MALTALDLESTTPAAPRVEPNRDELNWTKFVRFAALDLPAPTLKNSEVARVWRIYQANIDRLSAMMALPALVGWVRGIHQLCYDVARFRITGVIELSDDGLDEETKSEVNALTARIMAEQGASIDAMIAKEKTGEHLNDKAVNIIIGMTILNEQSKLVASFQNVPGHGDGVQHFIDISITSAWTAFEAMAEDLWEATIKELPDSISNDKSGYAFTSLRKIRKSYVGTFSLDADDIMNTLMANIFDQISALRNVIVHNAGICDDPYLRLQREIDGLPKAVMGEKVRINGELGFQLMTKCYVHCTSLATSVDRWICGNRPSNPGSSAAPPADLKPSED